VIPRTTEEDRMSTLMTKAYRGRSSMRLDPTSGSGLSPTLLRASLDALPRRDLLDGRMYPLPLEQMAHTTSQGLERHLLMYLIDLLKFLIRWARSTHRYRTDLLPSDPEVSLGNPASLVEDHQLLRRLDRRLIDLQEVVLSLILMSLQS